MAREGAGLEFCTINPSVVLSPVWDRVFSASVVLVKKLFDGSMGAGPDIGFGVVDVRDLDARHAKAVLGWQPKPTRNTVVDTARGLIELGIVKV